MCAVRRDPACMDSPFGAWRRPVNRSGRFMGQITASVTQRLAWSRPAARRRGVRASKGVTAWKGPPRTDVLPPHLRPVVQDLALNHLHQLGVQALELLRQALRLLLLLLLPHLAGRLVAPAPRSSLPRTSAGGASSQAAALARLADAGAQVQRAVPALQRRPAVVLAAVAARRRRAPLQAPQGEGTHGVVPTAVATAATAVGRLTARAACVAPSLLRTARQPLPRSHKRPARCRGGVVVALLLHRPLLHSAALGARGRRAGAEGGPHQLRLHGCGLSASGGGGWRGRRPWSPDWRFHPRWRAKALQNAAPRPFRRVEQGVCSRPRLRGGGAGLGLQRRHRDLRCRTGSESAAGSATMSSVAGGFREGASPPATGRRRRGCSGCAEADITHLPTPPRRQRWREPRRMR